MRTNLLYGAVFMASIGMAATGFAAEGVSERSSGAGSSAQQQNQEELAATTVEGTVLEIQKDEYYMIRDSMGDEVRLDVRQGTLVDETIAEGDRVEAQVTENGRAIAIRKASRVGGEQQTAMTSEEPRAQRSAQAESKRQGHEMKGSRAQQAERDPSHQAAKKSGDFTRTIKGEVIRIQENLYYVQDEEGKEVRLRIDESVKKQGDIKKGDKVEVMVTKAKEYHVISIKSAKESQSKKSQ